MRERICKISLFSVILACVSAVPVDAAVKTKNSNRAYAPAYQQINALRNQQEYQDTLNTAAVVNLPVAVDDEKLANSIVNNEVGAPSVSDLEACSMIYMNGNFKWGRPEQGINHDPQCIAVVELRDANTNAVLASTTVAAGQSIKCNIDSFPSGSYNMSALSKIELPADVAPTMEDVIAVMNAEQKQNAGLKIAAGAIIAGVAGNLLSQQDTSKDTNNKIPLGTGKSQLLGTAAGVATGAGIMAASSYSGKVAGDTIKSTAVNAASGMLIGNMLAGTNGGDSVIAVTKCSVNGHEHDCVVGKYAKKSEDFEPTDGDVYIITPSGVGIQKCTQNDNTDDLYICEPCGDKCKNLGNYYIRRRDGSSVSLDDVKNNKNTGEQPWYWVNEDSKPETFSKSSYKKDNYYYEVVKADVLESPKQAYAVFDTSLNKAFGYKEWNELSPKNPKIHIRYSGGGVGDEIKDAKATDFYPSSRDAEDGGLIDLSNPARAKGTIAGTAAGGALGGFAGYQGAQSEVSERWVSALREYEDSLSNFVCSTGIRFLSKYNDYADIPALKQDK